MLLCPATSSSTAATYGAPIGWSLLQDLDAAFHLRIVEAAGNRFMARVLGVRQETLARGMETTLQIPHRLKKSEVDHKRILDAVLPGEPTAARKRLHAIQDQSD